MQCCVLQYSVVLRWTRRAGSGYRAGEEKEEKIGSRVRTGEEAKMPLFREQIGSPWVGRSREMGRAQLEQGAGGRSRRGLLESWGRSSCAEDRTRP